MNVIEKLSGETEEELREHEWQSKDAIEDYTWPQGVALRGSVRLAAGLMMGRKEIQREWQSVSSSLRKLL